VKSKSGQSGEVLAVDGILSVACGEGSLEIQTVQPDGSRQMSAADFLMGNAIKVGDTLGSSE